MKILVLALVALGCGVHCFAAAPVLPEARVEIFDEEMPTAIEPAKQFVWERFSKKDEKEAQTPDFRVAEWESLRDRYAADLVARAKAAGLEADRLAAVLKTIDKERGSLAVVPLEAYRGRQGNRQVWVVFCRWEIAGGKLSPNLRLGHQRVFAYDMSTLERVAFETCM